MTKTQMMTLAVSMTMVCAFAGRAAAGDEKKPAAAAAAPAGGAAPAGAMPMPKPAADWTAFAKSMEGNWKCESTMPAGAMGPGSPEMKMQGTAKVKQDLGGFWLSGLFEIKGGKGSPGMKGNFTLGSPDGKSFVSENADS